ncbi:prolyl oligopeptidase family serine peptidase [Flavihumibacter solisilvae]|uniref:carboxylesterase family protein n=1 Tax=Flavihumibacter solisilvae TaxID=1349421 RepID=UPI00090795C4|nr:prolyl oligopeptidase family serine peptidase [Flavihumibacter solisilvae]
MQFIYRLFTCLSLIFAVAGLAKAQQTSQKFVRETNYLLSMPQGYASDTSTRWPLMLFLHGSGESGSDIEKVKVHGPPSLAAKSKQFPFIVVSPQSAVPNGWDVEMLYQLIQDVKKRYRVDDSRVYLTGLSMGGFGTWSLAMKYPDEFAAIAPVCGGGDTAGIWKLRHIPIWCFHGAKDDVVLPASSIKMVEAARKYNPEVRFTLYPEANHNSWDSAYNSSDSLYDWFLAHRKFKYSEIKVPETKLKDYEGWYVAGADDDTVRLFVQNSSLIAIGGRDTIPLKAAGDQLFFIDPARNIDVEFIRRKNKVTGFLFSGRERVIFRKIR